MNIESKNDESIFVVIYFFILLLILGLLYYFIPPARLILIALIGVTALTFVLNLIISFFRITARKNRVLKEWAERKESGYSGEKKEDSGEQPSRAGISYADREIKTGVCGRCGGRLVLRKSRQGAYSGSSFYGCSNFPKCRKIINVGETPYKPQVKFPGSPPVCDKCGSKMVLRKARRGRFKGQEFYGCGKYPECKNIVNLS